VVGPGGAGKSTFSQRLGAALNLPVVDLDQAFARTAPADRPAIVSALILDERWILDGDHLPSQPLRFSAADTVVFLDLSTAVCFWRLLRRALVNRGARRGQGTAQHPLGGRWQTAAWVLRYRTRGRPAVLRNLGEHARACRVAIARTSADAERLLLELSAPLGSRSLMEEHR
jgi:adenylate kinase family enzyme